MPSAIVCDALTRDFGEIRAVDSLTLAVPAGSIFAFLGPNGAGKTTTIHLLLGVLEPTAGAARVLGFDPVRDGMAIRRKSGALLEHAGLYERLTAEQNLRFYARIAHLSEEESSARIAELLTRFGLYDRRDDTVGTWSRGMKQKLAIARALLHRPELVFLDEPTAGLDPEATVALRNDIRSLDTTVFLTTHNLTDVEKMATHVAVIRKGQLLDFGSPAELRARAMRSHVTIRMRDRPPLELDLAGGASVAPVITRLVHEGAQIEEVRREEPSLEDVFLHLVKRDAPQPAKAAAIEPLSEERPAIEQRPIFRDLVNIIRKEWSEMMSQAETGTSKRTATIVGVTMLIVLAAMAAVVGAQVVRSPAVLMAGMVAFIVALASISDSFAGERERHTLETLVASAIPDEAMLLGKIAASVLYGQTAMLFILAALLIGANIGEPGVFYPLSTLLAAFLLIPLALLFFATSGVWISLVSPTVKAAQARVSVFLFSLFIGFVLLNKVVPSGWEQRAYALMQTKSGYLYAMLTQIAVLLIVDVVLLAFAVVRFRRARMI